MSKLTKSLTIIFVLYALKVTIVSGEDADINATPVAEPTATSIPYNTPSDALPQEEGANSSDDAEIDLSGLKMFMQQGDNSRVEKELRRLQALHPNWRPPKDLKTLLAEQAADNKEEIFWRMINSKEITQARVFLAEQKAQQPLWEASKAVEETLQVIEDRERILNAYALEQYQSIFRISQKNTKLISCKDPEILWAITGALGELGHTDNAVEGYRYMLTQCREQMDVKTVFWKASKHLPRNALVTLQSAVSEKEVGTSSTIIKEFSIKRLIEWIADWNPQKGKPDKTLIADAKALEKSFHNQPKTEEALVLGWFYRTNEEKEKTYKWFKQAYQLQPSQETAQAVGLALMENSHYVESEAFLYQWLTIETDPKTLDMYLAVSANLLSHIDPNLENRLPESDYTRVNRISEIALAHKSQKLAQSLGWLAFNFVSIEVAKDWFESCLTWNPDIEPAAYGLALSYEALGENEKVAMIKREWPDSNRIQLVGTGLHLLSLLPKPRRSQDLLTPPTNSQPSRQQSVAATDADLQSPSLPASNSDNGDLAGTTEQTDNKTPPPRNLPQFLMIDGEPVSATVRSNQRQKVATQEDTQIPEGMKIAGELLRRGQTEKQQIAEKKAQQVKQCTDPSLVETPGITRNDLRKRAKIRTRTSVKKSAKTAKKAATKTVTKTAKKAATKTAAKKRTSKNTRKNANAQKRRAKTSVERKSASTSRASSQKVVAKPNSKKFACKYSAKQLNRLSPSKALEYAWCMMNIHRNTQALIGFNRALKSKNARIVKDATYGKSLILLRKNMSSQVSKANQNVKLNDKKEKEIKSATLAQQALKAWNRKQYRNVIYFLQQRDRIAPARSDLMILKAWSYVKIGRKATAIKILEKLASTGNSKAQSALRDIRNL